MEPMMALASRRVGCAISGGRKEDRLEGEAHRMGLGRGLEIQREVGACDMQGTSNRAREMFCLTSSV